MEDKLDRVDEQLIERVVPEIRDELVGLALREIIQLRENRFAIAFEGDDFKLLFIALDPREPRIYLIKRRLRDLKKERQNPSKFAIDLEKTLFGMCLIDVSKRKNDRVLEFKFDSSAFKSLIAQLTGKSSNLFLLDADRGILAAARKPLDGAQSIGMVYSPPAAGIARIEKFGGPDLLAFDPKISLSESLDSYFQRKDEQEGFDAIANEARNRNQKAKSKFQRLIKNLEADILQHGDPDKWKKYGDLLLADQYNARRENGSLVVRDLFDESGRLISIEADDNDSVPEAAEKYFRKYTKARNAATQTAKRIELVRLQLADAEGGSSVIENAIATRDIGFLREYVGGPKKSDREAKQGRTPRAPVGIRSFRSSDGFEILVGKKASDNDQLTFRVAKSRDTWMHAADYPGSHVVIRNNDRKPIPQKTLIEAAQLAAFYSQGKKQTKAAVNYTEKKFVNKPKGAAPGLVRLASFKTILVEPTFPKVSQS